MFVKLEPIEHEMCPHQTHIHDFDKTDKEPKICKHWSYNDDYLFEVECPPLTLFVGKIGISVIGETIPNNPETIHSWVFVGCLNLSDKSAQHT